MSDQDIVTRIEAALAGTTPGPWRVAYSKVQAGADSRFAREMAEKGIEPVRAHGTLLVFQIEDVVDDVVAENGEHVVCFGHDHDDPGYVAAPDARLIAAAPTLLREAAATITRLRAAAQAVVDESSSDCPPSLGSIDRLARALRARQEEAG